MRQFLTFSHSVQGANHIRDGKTCQDASGVYENEWMSIVAVADGHGSSNYPRTDRGAHFAVDAAMEAIREFVNAVRQNKIDIISEQKIRLHDLELNILGRWHDYVSQDILKEPFQESELEKVAKKYKDIYLSEEKPCLNEEKPHRKRAKAYGTTLIAICATADYWFGLQIGDGKCFAISNRGECSEPIPWDENCQANVTTSLCDADAIDEFRSFCAKDFPLAVFIGSDGVDDSYAEDEELHDLYRTILCLFAEKGGETGAEEIKDFLPTMSRKGSGDDISMAGIISQNIHTEVIRLLSCQQECSTLRRKKQKLDRELAITKEKLDAGAGDRQERFSAEYENLLQSCQETQAALLEAERHLNNAKALVEAIPSGDLELPSQGQAPPRDSGKRKKKKVKRTSKKMNWSKRHKKRKR